MINMDMVGRLDKDKNLTVGGVVPLLFSQIW